MRPITFHAINPCNEVIKLIAADGPGPGGASHQYHIDVVPPGKNPAQIAYEAYCEQTGWKSLVTGADLPRYEDLNPEIQTAWNKAALAIVKGCILHPTLHFQNGPVKEDGNGVNGLTHEVLLAILIDRIEGFQTGPWACPENALTLGYLRAALAQLHARTNAREARGVEGTHQV